MKVTEHHLNKSQPAESVSSTSYYVKGAAVILSTGAAYAIVKTTGVLSWLWSGIEAYTSGATVSEEKAVQTISSAIQASPKADPLLSPLKPPTGSASSRRVEELDSLDLVELDRESDDKAAQSTTGEIHAPGRRLLQTTTPAEMTINYCEPSGTCQLTTLSDGQLGFTLQGQTGDQSGFSVSSAGDINGDRLDDILVGAPFASGIAGKTTVVFGSNQSGAWGTIVLDLATLADGQRGFVLLGQAGDLSGWSVSGAGDINGDQLDDILVGARGAGSAGKITVVFGSNQSGAWGTGTLNLAALADGQRGFVLQGQAGDGSVYSVSYAGDINGDRLGDILVGAPGIDGIAGKITVVFGSNQSGAWGNGTLNLTAFADGQRGFALLGQAWDFSGFSVSSAGDINGDQLDDILVGNPRSDTGQAEQTTVVFGSSQLGAWGTGTLNLATLADGQRGFVLQGQVGHHSGWSVSSAGDINGDRLDDILVGAPWAFSYAGEATVVFGSSQSGAWGTGTLNLATLADGQRGFVLQGQAGDYSGSSVSYTGDINGDQLDDILVGAPFASNSAGKTTVVFGSNQPGAWGTGTLNLAALADGQRGFVLQGQVGDESGWSVSYAGDINGDHLDDILVGAPYALGGNPNGAGKITVVLGDRSTQVIANQLSIAVGEVIPLNTNMLAVTSMRQNNATIVLTPEAVQHGRFEAIDVPGVALSSFLSGNITAVQFRQDGSGLAPSYQIEIYRTPLLYAYSIAQVDFLGYPPVLLNNAVYVNQGFPTLVTTSDLSTSDADTASASLRFLFSEVQHAQFNLLESNGTVITANISSCLQQFVLNQQLQLMPDGSVIAPSYRVAVSNGRSTIPSTPAVVTFNQAPVLTVHSIILDQGQATLIRPQDISATDDHTLSYDLLFQVANVTSGDYFEYLSNVGYELREFPQFPLSIGNVEFFQNGSNIPPSFYIRVSDGVIESPWQTLTIYFNHRPLSQRTIPTQTVVEGKSFSIDLGEDLFTDPDGNTLTLSAQQNGGVPLPNGITFDANRAELNGILETLISLEIQIIAGDPRGLTASTDFTLQSIAPKPGFDYQKLYSALSILGSAAVTVLGYMWWRRKAASHRTGYEFANTLRKVLNLEYYDFTKDKGELYKTHIERLLAHFEYKHNNFYATLTSPGERRSFAVCVAEVIRSKDLLKKSDCSSAAYNRFFLFSPSWPSGLKLDEFGRLSSQIAQEAVTAWNAESQKEDGDPLTRWPYRSSSVPETKAVPSSEMEVVEIKEPAGGKSSASSGGYSDSLFPTTARKSSREAIIHGHASGAALAAEISL